MSNPSTLKKVLDSTEKRVYNLVREVDGRLTLPTSFPARDKTMAGSLLKTFKPVFETFQRVWKENSDLFPTPPVFAGGFFRDLVWGGLAKDIDIFFNSHGMTNEEAEDNLCLFLDNCGYKVTERISEYHDSTATHRLTLNPRTLLYDLVPTGPSQHGLKGVFRVFDQTYTGENFADINDGGILVPFQVILKDCGPPTEDPLYVTEGFNYNHGMMAMSVAEDLVLHASGPAVFGWESSCHVQYGPKGFDKAQRGTYHSGVAFKQLDLTKPLDYDTTPLGAKKRKVNERNTELEQYRKKGGRSFMSPLSVL